MNYIRKNLVTIIIEFVFYINGAGGILDEAKEEEMSKGRS